MDTQHTLKHTISFNINGKVDGQEIAEFRYTLSCDGDVLLSDTEDLRQEQLTRTDYRPPRAEYAERHFKQSLINAAQQIWTEAELFQAKVNARTKEQRQWASEPIKAFI